MYFAVIALAGMLYFLWSAQLVFVGAGTIFFVKIRFLCFHTAKNIKILLLAALQVAHVSLPRACDKDRKVLCVFRKAGRL